VIDFRYHIVSLIAVFLALGLGILMGSSVLSGQLVERFEQDLSRARESRQQALTRAGELRDELDQQRVILEQIAPLVLEGRLTGRRILLVRGPVELEWSDRVRDVLVRAGAEPVGTLVLSEKWALTEPAAREELDAVLDAAVPSFDPGEAQPAQDVLRFLGQRLRELTGRDLIDRLAQAGFLTPEGRPPDQEWPPADTGVLVMSANGRSAHPGWLAAFARGASDVAGTLVTSATDAEGTAVALLRGGEGPAPRLSTFDAVGVDSTGIGTVAALEVALSERGGHYGTADGLRFVPPPA
jgi:hypothetical protein